jgi:hypothetical protein
MHILLGELIGEFKGNRVAMRVLAPEGGSPRIEANFQETGKLLGVEVTNFLTFVVTMHPGGLIYAEGILL